MFGVEKEDKMGEIGDFGESGDRSSSDLLEICLSDIDDEPSDFTEPGRRWPGNAELMPWDDLRYVRITVPVDSTEESDVSDVLFPMGACAGTRVKS